MSQTPGRIGTHCSLCRMGGREVLARLDGLLPRPTSAPRPASRAGAMLRLVEAQLDLWRASSLSEQTLNVLLLKKQVGDDGGLQHSCQCSFVELAAVCEDWRVGSRC
jgi:hypothetical protein